MFRRWPRECIQSRPSLTRATAGPQARSRRRSGNGSPPAPILWNGFEPSLPRCRIRTCTAMSRACTSAAAWSWGSTVSGGSPARARSRLCARPGARPRPPDRVRDLRLSLGPGLGLGLRRGHDDARRGRSGEDRPGRATARPTADGELASGRTSHIRPGRRLSRFRDRGSPCLRCREEFTPSPLQPFPVHLGSGATVFKALRYRGWVGRQRGSLVTPFPRPLTKPDVTLSMSSGFPSHFIPRSLRPS